MKNIHNIIFASYGNDSIALIQWCKENKVKNVVVCYMDTGWAAPWWHERIRRVDPWIQSLGFTSVILESIGMEELARQKQAWPRGGGGKFQFCTQELKKKPSQEWMAEVDPHKQATCIIGVRREESANRRTHPEHIIASEAYGGRDLWAPLVRHLVEDRDALLQRAGFDPLPFRSKECWPCVNARKGELRNLTEPVIARIEALEKELGVNSKGNPRVMFSPRRHNGSVGIRAVIEDAKNSPRAAVQEEVGRGCDAGWCGD